ncbi:FAD-dependent oxidoreductase [Nocardioides panaciterrulae]|uniref:2-polyprenyl-6-methoxyphenol hydroxylase-like FAD-dependent oxidoreductase n=1 Tax=Nocardioides panaciterrulae TaxID=661492 RepID=A0A7Y9E5D7_9ACTN|nr:FAD-dependent oxidoreductase [Nocardioides panaciterrulae]NYD41533.1 2-polyprenyl-6-methoxyphenol hydroxylase-like FAD-dependent oxidoreductase [Nocardioides panaciterrulae]
MDTDVVVVGAGPTGLMLAGELAQAGMRTLLLERRPEPSETAKAGGLAGQILQLLHYKGELDRFREASTGPEPAPRFPFGGVHLDFTRLADVPMRAMPLPQPRLEAVLAERAIERGADVRRGHALAGLHQDQDAVTAEVRGPDGPYAVPARFLVGCDGGRSRVRELAGIPFPGTSFPEIERLASVTVPDSVTVLEDGGLDVPGVGRIPFGYTATERGVFACSGLGGTMSVYTAEVEATEYDDDVPMSVPELSASVSRVLGIELPLGDPLRMTRFGYSAKQADTYRLGRVLLAGDAAHLFPAGGVAVNAGMLDAANLAWKLAGSVHGWAPPGLLDTYSEERRAAAERTLLHTRAQVALRRGHGPGGDALRALFLELTADEQPLRRLGALMAGTDVGSPMSEAHPLVGTFATDRALHVAHQDPRFAGLLREGRPVLLDLADRADLRELARQWGDRVDVVSASIDERPGDALLIRPDGRIAWAAAVDAPGETALPALREALTTWFGVPSI